MRLSYLILDHVTYHVSYYVIMFQVYDYIIYFQQGVGRQQGGRCREATTVLGNGGTALVSCE